MNKQYVFQNNLQDILDDRGITQKELAKLIGEREASVSEFIKFKRTTINIDLLLKILSALKLSSLDELISLKMVYQGENYSQNKWYTFSCNERARFAYVCCADELTFEFAEVMENGTLLHQKYALTELDEEHIKNEFLEVNISLSEEATEDNMTLMLIELCKYKGKLVSAMRYKTLEEAIETLDMLY